MDKYQVVVHAGYQNEELHSEWNTYDDAYCAMHENFTPEEQLELGVDIMKNWSYEL